MSYSRKTQSRLWVVSIVYKTIVLHRKLPYLKKEITSVDDLKKFFDDPCIFEHEDGDEREFVDTYNIVSLHFNTLMEIIAQRIDPRSLTNVGKACTLCALAEIKYLDESCETALMAYSKILKLYSEDPSDMINVLRSLEN